MRHYVPASRSCYAITELAASSGSDNDSDSEASDSSSDDEAALTCNQMQPHSDVLGAMLEADAQAEDGTYSKGPRRTRGLCSNHLCSTFSNAGINAGVGEQPPYKQGLEKINHLVCILLQRRYEWEGDDRLKKRELAASIGIEIKGAATEPDLNRWNYTAEAAARRR